VVAGRGARARYSVVVVVVAVSPGVGVTGGRLQVLWLMWSGRRLLLLCPIVHCDADATTAALLLFIVAD